MKTQSLFARIGLALALALTLFQPAGAADKLVPSRDDTAAVRRFRDMGDSTWAEVISLPTASAFQSQVATTRPANVTAYTANDVLGAAAAAWTFPSMGTTGGQVMITSVDLRIDVAAVPAGMTSFRLYLYSVTPASALADNAAWDLPAGDRPGYIGYIDLGTPVDLGSTLFVEADGVNKHLKLAPGDTALYGYLVTNGGFTPAGNSEVYTITLRGVGL